jgi:hypothetical protein
VPDPGDIQKPQSNFLAVRGAKLLLWLLLAAAPAHAASVQVDATGSGATQEDAVPQALVEAIQKVTGVAVQAPEEIRAAIAVAQIEPNGKRRVLLGEAQQRLTRTSTNGVVRSYQLIDVLTNKPGRVVVHLSAEVEKFQPVDTAADSRRRIAVAYFGPSTMRPTANLLHDRLVAQLTQSQRLLVLDRANELVFQQEMAVL